MFLICKDCFNVAADKRRADFNHSIIYSTCVGYLSDKGSAVKSAVFLVEKSWKRGIK